MGTAAASSHAPSHAQTSGVHHGATRAIASSPSGFTPGPAASAWPTRACRHFTRSGMPPAETPAISGTGPVPASAPTRSRSAM